MYLFLAHDVFSLFISSEICKMYDLPIFVDFVVFLVFDTYRENYIKVDIFYKDLSYEQVKQQVSFELMSLFSELGGLLGLLLGASVLTVCELIDFVVLLFVRQLRVKPKESKT